MDVSQRDRLAFLKIVERYELRYPSNLSRFLGAFELCAASERSLIGASKHPLYGRWRGMMSRCYNPNVRVWEHYGGRGIIVEPRWHSFSSFVEDMKAAPKGMSLDRIDVNGNYGPGNCRWATGHVQAANRRVRTTSQFPIAPGVLEELNRREAAFISAVRARHG